MKMSSRSCLPLCNALVKGPVIHQHRFLHAFLTLGRRRHLPRAIFVIYMSSMDKILNRIAGMGGGDEEAVVVNRSAEVLFQWLVKDVTHRLTRYGEQHEIKPIRLEVGRS